jgi:ketosteroid isomerase-like protein
VIHRDVKPGNIMVDEEGFTVITDFGIAKATEAEGLTQTGIVIGTPSYVCPEACAGQPSTAASDQYSLGVVAYQLITGRKPFVADSTMAVMYAQIHTPPTPIRELRPDCPPALAAAVHRMMAKAPADRWPSLREAVAAIGAAMPPSDEAVREMIRQLARNRPERWVLEQFVTPVSPAPVNQPTPLPIRGAGMESAASPRPAAPAVSPGAVPTPEVPTLVTAVAVDRSARAQSLRFKLLLAAVLALAVWVLGPWSRSAAPPAAVRDSTPPPNDSLLVSARGAADFARGRAVAAGAGAMALAPGDSLSELGKAEATQGKLAEAAVHLTSAAGMYSAAEKGVGAKAQTPAASSGPSPAPRTAPTPAPEPSDSEKIARFYHDLEQAISARQIGEVKRLLPNLSDNDERPWRGLFDDHKVENIGMTYTILNVTRDGQTAYAKLLSDLAVTKHGQTEHRTRRLLTTLTLGPQGWRQIREEEVK